MSRFLSVLNPSRIRGGFLALGAACLLAARSLIAQEPQIELSTVPRYGSNDNLEGRASNVAPSTHKVAVYIYPQSWWTKPTFAQPLTSIQPDGSWTCDITTGGIDSYATKIAAFLIHQSHWEDVPILAGAAKLPDSLESIFVASVVVSRPPGVRTISFCGYRWTVKLAETGRVGPNLNYFSDDEQGVWVDPQGRLHLTIRKSGSIWYCSEVVCNKSLGYGKYVFHLSSRVDKGALDPNVVLGMFTWEDDTVDHNYREIDTEFSSWGSPEEQDGQYVIQPYTAAGNCQRFDMQSVAESAHVLNWQANGISFRSVAGHDIYTQTTSDVIHQWTYAGADNPAAGNESPRINLWLNNPDAHINGPSDGQDVELVVSRFQFIPAWENETDAGAGWYWSDWFGLYNKAFFPWLYHAQHRWWYCASLTPQSLWVWEPDMGWVWTSADAYPFLYRVQDGAWLYYIESTRSPRLFYNFSTWQWEQH